MSDPFDLDRAYIHLGLGATATPLPEFRWDDEHLKVYMAAHATDGEYRSYVERGTLASCR